MEKKEKGKILVLESGDFASELERTLKARNGEWEVVVLDDGEMGVELLKREKVDVVLLDLVLKGRDGFFILDEIRRNEYSAKALVLGNFSDDRVVTRAISSGADYYIVKPVSADVVVDRVEELLEVLPRITPRRNNEDERISNIFITIGIPPHIKGYSYLREAIKIVVDEPNAINNVTKGLYPMVAERHFTTPSKVERAIRHAIEVAWNRGRIDAISSVFGARVYIGSEKPTNSEFIALVADKLILENMA